MFTGIVEEAGRIIRVDEGTTSIRLRLSAPLCAEGVRLGDSLAVNGCCLTIIEFGKGELEFDLLRETWNRTNLHRAAPDSRVNLERSLPANGRLHGHFVSGHVEGTGEIEVFEQRGADWFLRVQAAPEILRYVVFKGAIALDGISLTVAEVDERALAVWIIPHTRGVTALRDRKPGDLLNIETDLLAKYVEKLVMRP